MIKKFLLLVVVALLLWLAFGTGFGEYLKPDFYRELYRQQPLLTAALFFLAYVVMAALSIPGAALMTILAGAIFGLFTGTVLVSFASSIGATLAFLVSRTLLRDWVEARFGRYLVRIHRGIERDGDFYLFTLRLIPAIPFFVINLVFGLTRMATVRFYLVSQVGMLAGTLVYVNAGAQLGTVDSLSVSGVLTPGLVGGFVLLGLFPYLARAVVAGIRRARVYAPWRSMRPAQYDANLVVIGAGSGGLVAAYIAAAVRARVVLVEKERMGGDCLNTGCVPSKALLKSASVRRLVARAGEFGLDCPAARVDFPQVMARVQRVIQAIEPHDSVERYRSLGVDVVSGEAELLSPWEVKVGDRVIRTRNIVLATGARPRVPPYPGLEQISYLTTDTIWQLERLPGRLLVLGSGPVGCELAQAFCRLGSEVSVAFRSSRLLPREDEDVAGALSLSLEAEGVQLLPHCQVIEFRQDGEGGVAILERDGVRAELAFDCVLVATGRAASLTVPGVERLELERNDNGTLAVDESLRTRFPNIYACGDLVGPYQLTHAASHQAWYATVNALFSPLRRFSVDYRVLPHVTFTDPEIAVVGLTEQEAAEQGVEYELTRYGIDDLDRAIADGEAHGFVKVLTEPGRDRILGAVVVGYQAGNLIAELVLAMKQNIGLNKILGTVHAYPTLVEANKYAAGVWKRNHAPARLLRWLERFHAWRR